MKKNHNHGGHVLGVPVTSVSYAPGEEPAASVPESGFVTRWMSKFKDIRQRVISRPKRSETIKGRSSLSSRIVEAGGVQRVFRQVFNVEKGEKLLKVSQCYLWTTAGPIAGILFISTEKVAFHSDRLLELNSPEGQLARVPYKVLIPLRRMKRVISSESAYQLNQKYVQIVTKDDFEFWFMGFPSYQKSFKYLQQALSGSN